MAALLFTLTLSPVDHPNCRSIRTSLDLKEFKFGSLGTNFISDSVTVSHVKKTCPDISTTTTALDMRESQRFGSKFLLGRPSRR